MLAVVIALEPEPEIPAGLSFVLMAFFLGLGAGGVFTLGGASLARHAGGRRHRHRRCRRRPRRVLSAAGNGSDVRRDGQRLHLGLGLLCVTALVALAFVLLRLRPEPRR